MREVEILLTFHICTTGQLLCEVDVSCIGGFLKSNKCAAQSPAFRCMKGLGGGGFRHDYQSSNHTESLITVENMQKFHYAVALCNDYTGSH